MTVPLSRGVSRSRDPLLKDSFSLFVDCPKGPEASGGSVPTDIPRLLSPSTLGSLVTAGASWRSGSHVARMGPIFALCAEAQPSALSAPSSSRVTLTIRSPPLRRPASAQLRSLGKGQGGKQVQSEEDRLRERSAASVGERVLQR